MFKIVDNFFITSKRDISITNCVACVTDGTSAMIGCQCDFIAHLKNANLGILTVHCIIHR